MGPSKQRLTVTYLARCIIANTTVKTHKKYFFYYCLVFQLQHAQNSQLHTRIEHVWHNTPLHQKPITDS
jgi:hypothetical protein